MPSVPGRSSQPQRERLPATGIAARHAGDGARPACALPDGGLRPGRPGAAPRSAPRRRPRSRRRAGRRPRARGGAAPNETRHRGSAPAALRWRPGGSTDVELPASASPSGSGARISSMSQLSSGSAPSASAATRAARRRGLGAPGQPFDPRHQQPGASHHEPDHERTELSEPAGDREQDEKDDLEREPGREAAHARKATPRGPAARRSGCRAPSSCSGVTSDGAPLIGSTPGLVLRERDHVAEVRLAGEHHRHPVDAERDPAVRRRAHRQRVEQEAELRPAAPPGSSLSRSKTFAWISGSWIRNEPPPSSLPLTMMS